jgi:hypothetical protein
MVVANIAIRHCLLKSGVVSGDLLLRNSIVVSSPKLAANPCKDGNKCKKESVSKEELQKLDTVLL